MALKKYHTAAKHIFGHHELRGIVIAELGRHIRAELRKATGDNSESIINQHNAGSLQSFSWESLETDLSKNCVQLHNFLQLCVPKRKLMNSRGMLSLIIAMLAKFTNQKVRYVETILSLMLLSGHATNEVSIH